MTLAAPWKRCAWWGPEDGDSERQGVLSCFLLCCLGLRYQQMLRRTSNPSVNSNKLGNGAMDRSGRGKAVNEPMISCGEMARPKRRGTRHTIQSLLGDLRK